MRAAGTTVLAAVLMLALAVPAAGKPPTRRQITRAVGARRASRVAVGDDQHLQLPRASPAQIGVRGQMPSLGFSSTMSMTITLDSWSSSRAAVHRHQQPQRRRHARWALTPADWSRAGPCSRSTGRRRGCGTRRSLHLDARGQGGRPDAAPHHRRPSNADFGSPPHYSAAQCRIAPDRAAAHRWQPGHQNVVRLSSPAG